MIPGRAVGRLVAASVVDSLSAVPLLLVQPLDDKLTPVGTPVVACDSVGVNVGELVYMAQGREATFPLPIAFNPADLTIVAIIDQVTS